MWGLFRWYGKLLFTRTGAVAPYAFPRGEGGFFGPTKEGRKRRMRNGEMLNIVGSLLQRKSRSITTRIPHQSENAFGAFPDSFPPGEAILRRIVSKLNNNLFH